MRKRHHRRVLRSLHTMVKTIGMLLRCIGSAAILLLMCGARGQSSAMPVFCHTPLDLCADTSEVFTLVVPPSENEFQILLPVLACDSIVGRQLYLPADDMDALDLRDADAWRKKGTSAYRFSHTVVIDRTLNLVLIRCRFSSWKKALAVRKNIRIEQVGAISRVIVFQFIQEQE
ncbi:MAG: hypothetical protein K1X58_10150 [Flavobacteriales bacterium]|jgi:hypothetical protein|nr:hypothetical protein [Flavobacteriales bacterium]